MELPSVGPQRNGRRALLAVAATAAAASLLRAGSMKGSRCALRGFAVPAIRVPTTAGRVTVVGRLSEPLLSANWAHQVHPAVVRAASMQATAVEFRHGMGEAAAALITGGMQVALVPCLGDNYAPLLHDKSTGATATVDTPDAGPILAALEARGWSLTHVLNTHHHYDHTGGNEELKRRTGCQIIGPANEADRIPGLDVAVADGDRISVGSFEAKVLDVGGHTAGHIAYHFPGQSAAFVGDALFVLGCGRIFEGTPAQMWGSLQKIRDLPDDTVVYCAHEYTESNARFAKHLGGVPGLADRLAAIADLRSSGKATVPTLLGHEKATNPFLRADTDAIREAVGLAAGTPAVQVFAEVRGMKDRF